VTRAYVPATRELLGAWHAAGGVPTDAERVVAPGDDEDLEYAALMTAADLASGLGAADGRRTPDADPDDDLGWFGVQEIPDLL
jgi:hypothetical protein